MVKSYKKILIAGDSFAAKWVDTDLGWVNKLESEFDITNRAQAGCGEYKILKQLLSTNLDDYDCIIVSHTSPSRIHVPSHPLHKTGFHKDCDLIYNDIIDRFDFPYTSLSVAKGWFENFYDDEYQLDIYRMIREKINSIIEIPYISMSHIDLLKKESIESLHLDFSGLWKNNRGNVNHYNEFGNQFIADKIKFQIKKIGKKNGK